MTIIVGIFLLILEGVISNYVGYLPFSFSPRFSCVLFYLFFFAFLRKKEKKRNFWLFFFFGFLYDLLYTSVYFWHSINFVLTFLLLRFFQKKGYYPTLILIFAFLFSISFDYVTSVVLFQTPFSFYFTYILQIVTSNLPIFVLFIICLFFYSKRKLSSKRR